MLIKKTETLVYHEDAIPKALLLQLFPGTRMREAAKKSKTKKTQPKKVSRKLQRKT